MFHPNLHLIKSKGVGEGPIKSQSSYDISSLHTDFADNYDYYSEIILARRKYKIMCENNLRGL